MVVVNVGPVGDDSIAQRLWVLPYGRASVLFVVLAGVGMSFFLSRDIDPLRRRATVLWRAALLMIGGLGLQLAAGGISVILPLYGALFVLVLLVHRLRTRTLGALAVSWALLGPVVVVVAAETGVGRATGSASALGDAPVEIVRELLLTGRYPLVTWVVPFLAGLWLGRTDLRDRRSLRRLVVVGGIGAVVSFVVAQVTRAGIGADADVGVARLVTGAAHGQMPLWLISSVGGALAVIAAALLWWPRFSRYAAPLVPVGRWALSLYVLHVLLLAVVRAPQGFSLPEGIVVSVLMVTAFCVLVPVLESKFGVGPLERILRSAPWEAIGRRSTSDPVANPVARGSGRADSPDVAVAPPRLTSAHQVPGPAPALIRNKAL